MSTKAIQERQKNKYYYLNRDNVDYLDSLVKNEMNKITNEILRKCLSKGMLRKFPYNKIDLIIKTGSKGSLVNLSQISSLLGQQELEGKRVPLMVNGKSLPILKEVNIESGGFIIEGFLMGIKPHSYYFHCMAGREGLIDTAVKTSRSGYLQRCLIKHLEGVKVCYDKTVRNNQKIISFKYGEDGLDCTKTSFLNDWRFLKNNYEELMKLYLKEAESRDGSAAQRYKRDIFLDTDKKPNKAVLKSLNKWRRELAKVQPGDSVGVIAGQSLGEPSTQMTLNTFHLAGVGSKNVTLGIPRLVEILMLASKKIKTPYLSIISPKDLSCMFYKRMLGEFLRKLVVSEGWLFEGSKRFKKLSVKFFIEKDIGHVSTRIQEDFLDVLTMKIRKTTHNFVKTMEKIQNFREKQTLSIKRGENEYNQSFQTKGGHKDPFEQSDAKRMKGIVFHHEYTLTEKLLNLDILLDIGIDLMIYPLIEESVSELVVKQVKSIDNVIWSDGVLTFEGANFDILGLLTDFDILKSYTNDIQNIKTRIGIEASREVIIREVKSVFDAYGIDINHRHLLLIADYMTRTGNILPFSRNGFDKSDSILQKISFESCYAFIKKAVKDQLKDFIESPSSCQLLGMPVKCGTGCFDVIYDLE